MLISTVLNDSSVLHVQLNKLANDGGKSFSFCIFSCYCLQQGKLTCGKSEFPGKILLHQNNKTQRKKKKTSRNSTGFISADFFSMNEDEIGFCRLCFCHIPSKLNGLSFKILMSCHLFFLAHSLMVIRPGNGTA